MTIIMYKKNKLITRNRNYNLIYKVQNNLFTYHNITDKHVKVNKSLLGTKLGALSFTKKTGKDIHDSVNSLLKILQIENSK